MYNKPKIMNNTYKSNKVLDEIKAISFFSTSLYQKDSVEEVLWDITKNVIQRLGFVDCVIYTFDKENKILTQKAAYGQKIQLKTSSTITYKFRWDKVS